MSSDPVIDALGSLLLSWKSDSSTVVDLQVSVERFIGQTWIQNGEEHRQVYSLWTTFRNECLNVISGMTMNERLYSFSLFERFDACLNEQDRLTIYRKLLASP